MEDQEPLEVHENGSDELWFGDGYLTVGPAILYMDDREFAQRISAVNDLLEACEEMVTHVNAFNVPAPVIDKMRAAIAKARK